MSRYGRNRLILLPGTSHWDFPGDIANEQFIELRSYFEARIAAAAHNRRRYWEGPNWNETVEGNREELRRIIGAVERFLPLDPKTKQLGSNAAFTYSLVEWPLLRLGNAGSTGGSSTFLVREYGILLEPDQPGKRPAVIAIPDADQSAADIAGLTSRLPQSEQYARDLASHGYVVLVPFFTQRRAFSQPADGGSRLARPDRLPGWASSDRQ